MNNSLFDELASLYEQKAELTRKLGKAYRIKQVWKEAFGKEGKVETFTTQLGGTGTVPITIRYFIERLEDKVKREITQEQYQFIQGELNGKEN